MCRIHEKENMNLTASFPSKHPWPWILALAVFLIGCTAGHAVPASPPPAASGPVNSPERPGACKVGLVLSGGGARGAAHIGVLKILERENVPIDCIVGTSFGAIVGGLYAVGYRAIEIEQIMLHQDWRKLFSDTPERKLIPLAERKTSRYQGRLSFKGFSPELPSGLYSGQKLTELLDAYTIERLLAVDYDFDRLPIPFRAVATNLLDGKAYVFKEGRITEALRASTAIPMFFTPVEKEGMLLVDGGLANNLPVDIAREMGADIILAVDITSPLLKKEEIRTLVNVMDQAISLYMKQSVEKNRILASLVLQPDLEGFTSSDYGRFPELIRRGEKETEIRLAEIKAITAGMLRQPHDLTLPMGKTRAIETVSFQGLRMVPERQLAREVRTHPGNVLNPHLLRNDIARLYSTRLFENVGFDLQPSGAEKERYRLTFLLKEAPRNTLGAAIRYDKDFRLVALAEFTSRQLFHTPSTLTITSIFGGLEDHSATLRYNPPALSFLFVEPKVFLSRRERLDIRDGSLVDKFTDKRIGSQFLLGGSFFKRLEIKGGIRDEYISIGGGAPPNLLSGTMHLSGPTLHITRDTLDEMEFARSGSYLHLQFHKRSRVIGSDLSYSKWQADLDRYFSLHPRYVLHLSAGAGLSRGEVPFYDRFFLGGYNFSETGLKRLVGFDRDELAVSRMAIVGASIRQQAFSHPLSFLRGGYTSFFYNAVAFSDRWEAPYQFHILHGAGVGFALDSLIGPMRIACGWGEGGKWKLYLTLGPSF